MPVLHFSHRDIMTETKLVDLEKQSKVKVTLENWLHNTKPQMYKWKTDKKTWSDLNYTDAKLTYRTKEAYTETELEKMDIGEEIDIWTGWALDKRVKTEITSGWPWDSSEYVQRITLEGDMDSVQEMTRKLTPSYEEKLEWWRINLGMTDEKYEELRNQFDFKLIEDAPSGLSHLELVKKDDWDKKQQSRNNLGADNVSTEGQKG
jgi:hypothetical protein